MWMGRSRLPAKPRIAPSTIFRTWRMAVLVMSTIAKGRIVHIDTRAAERHPGVLAIMTPLNAPRLSQKAPQSNEWPRRPASFSFCKTTVCFTTISR